MLIASLSTSFKNNIPFGKTDILYINGTSISIKLNEFGFYCGDQKYYNKDNELIKIKQVKVDANLEWVKKNDFFFFLYKNDILTNTISTAGIFNS